MLCRDILTDPVRIVVGELGEVGLTITACRVQSSRSPNRQMRIKITFGEILSFRQKANSPSSKHSSIYSERIYDIGIISLQ